MTLAEAEKISFIMTEAVRMTDAYTVDELCAQLNDGFPEFLWYLDKKDRVLVRSIN